MPQIFHHSTNTISRVSIFGAVFFAIGFVTVLAILDRGAYWTRQTQVVSQPVPFSHDHHVAQIGIDCRYCHTSVENGAFAGIPPSQTCMNCHSQIWSDSPMLEPVRQSFRTGTPLQWTRVNDLPDFVYFDHSIHVSRGIGCVTCHGRVDQMPLMRQAETLQMGWCIECHRNPVPNVRPREEVFNVAWQEPAGFAATRVHLAESYDVQSMMSCSTCHR